MDKNIKEDLLLGEIVRKIKERVGSEYFKTGDLYNLEKSIFHGFNDLQKMLMEQVIAESNEKEISGKKKMQMRRKTN